MKYFADLDTDKVHNPEESWLHNICTLYLLYICTCTAHMYMYLLYICTCTVHMYMYLLHICTCTCTVHMYMYCAYVHVLTAHMYMYMYCTYVHVLCICTCTCTHANYPVMYVAACGPQWHVSRECTQGIAECILHMYV